MGDIKALRNLTWQLGGTVTKNGKYKRKTELISFITNGRGGGGKKVRFEEKATVIPIETYERDDKFKKSVPELGEVCIDILFKKYGIWEISDITLEFPESELDLLSACLKAVEDQPLTENEKKMIIEFYNRESAVLKRVRKQTLASYK